MKNKKIILIIIFLLITLTSSGFIFLQKNNKKNKTENSATISEETKSFEKTNINTNTEKKSNTLEKSSVNEDLLVVEIKNNIENKSIESIKKSILLVEKNSGGESVFEPWKDFLNKNSNQLLEIAKENNKELTKGVYLIFDWYINLSGEFEKLNSEKQELLSNQYLEIKSLIK